MGMYFVKDWYCQKIGGGGTKWVPKTWNGMPSFKADNIWKQGNNIYMGYGSGYTYSLDKSTSTWVQRGGPFTGASSGSQMLMIPYRYGSSNYEFYIDLSSGGYNNSYHGFVVTDPLSPPTNYTMDFYIYDMTNGVNISIIDKSSIWYDNVNNAIYYNYNSPDTYSYVLSSVSINSSYIYLYFEEISIHSLGVNFSGGDIWYDGNNSYLRNIGVFETQTYTYSNKWFNNKTWYGLNNLTNSFSSPCVWHDLDDTIYYSCPRTYSNQSDDNYVLDRGTSTWTPITWEGIPDGKLAGRYIWSDGDHIYYSNLTDQYVLQK